MNRAAAPLVLSEAQRATLQTLARSQTTPVRQVRRAQALLAAADGMANERIARQVGVSPATVRAWRADFAERGLSRFGMVRPGRGRKPSIPDETVEAIVEATRHGKPTGHTHWSCRTMAVEFGVSPATVQRIWAARGLKPHLVETFVDQPAEDRSTPDPAVGRVGDRRFRARRTQLQRSMGPPRVVVLGVRGKHPAQVPLAKITRRAARGRTASPNDSF